MRSGSRGLSTRVLLVCGALAAVHFLLHLITVAFLTFLAPTSPPLYGLFASIHALIPFLARRVTRAPGSATITAGTASLLVSATSPSGFILLVPLLATGLTIDLVAGRADRGAFRPRHVELRFLLAAVVLGSVLFLLSLAVFSPEHLTPWLVGCTFAGRILGEIAIAASSGVLARALFRAGIGRPYPGLTAGASETSLAGRPSW